MVLRSRRSTPHGTIEIARGESVTCDGSIFTAQIAWPVRTKVAAAAAIALLLQESVCGAADHNMTAFRVCSAGGKRPKVEKGYEDDGEARGGQRLLGALTKIAAADVAVVVSRVYGGVNIGKRRFELIASTATGLTLLHRRPCEPHLFTGALCEQATDLLLAVGHEPGEGAEVRGSRGHAPELCV